MDDGGSGGGGRGDVEEGEHHGRVRERRTDRECEEGSYIKM